MVSTAVKYCQLKHLELATPSNVLFVSGPTSVQIIRLIIANGAVTSSDSYVNTGYTTLKTSDLYI